MARDIIRTAQYKVSVDYSKRMAQLINMLNDKDVKIGVNTIIADAVQPYVPMKSGKLRRSRYVGVNIISWGRGLKYGHYQHEGVVYAPNIPIIKNGVIVGWYSKKGVKKHPTDRELGARGMFSLPSVGLPAQWMGWNFGYTTGGTIHHWERMYEWKLKSETNKKITQMLKAECRRRGLNV